MSKSPVEWARRGAGESSDDDLGGEGTTSCREGGGAVFIWRSRSPRAGAEAEAVRDGPSAAPNGRGNGLAEVRARSVLGRWVCVHIRGSLFRRSSESTVPPRS